MDGRGAVVIRDRLEHALDLAPLSWPFYQRIVASGESSWAVVHEPNMRRQLSRESVRRLVERVYQAAGSSYREMARILSRDDGATASGLVPRRS